MPQFEISAAARSRAGAGASYVGTGYKIASLNGDAQGSLSVGAEGESDENSEGVDDVVNRAPA